MTAPRPPRKWSSRTERSMRLRRLFHAPLLTFEAPDAWASFRGEVPRREVRLRTQRPMRRARRGREQSRTLTAQSTNSAVPDSASSVVGRCSLGGSAAASTKSDGPSPASSRAASGPSHDPLCRSTPAKGRYFMIDTTALLLPARGGAAAGSTARLACHRASVQLNASRGRQESETAIDTRPRRRALCPSSAARRVTRSRKRA